MVVVRCGDNRAFARGVPDALTRYMIEFYRDVVFCRLSEMRQLAVGRIEWDMNADKTTSYFDNL